MNLMVTHGPVLRFFGVSIAVSPSNGWVSAAGVTVNPRGVRRQGRRLPGKRAKLASGKEASVE
jgi:hypothetical protein